MFQLIVLTVNNPVQHHDHPRMLLLLVGVLLLQRLHLLVVVEQHLPQPELLLNLVELGQTQPSVLFDCLHLLIVLVLGVLDLNPVLVVNATEVSEVLLPNFLKGPLPLLVLLQLVNLKQIFSKLNKKSCSSTCKRYFQCSTNSPARKQGQKDICKALQIVLPENRDKNTLSTQHVETFGLYLYFA